MKLASMWRTQRPVAQMVYYGSAIASAAAEIENTATTIEQIFTV